MTARRAGFDVPIVFVEQVVMETADQHMVAEVCLLAVRPVNDVMGVQPPGRTTAQELAAILVPPNSQVEPSNSLNM